MRRSSHMGLRDEHRELTRQKVLAAVLDLVEEGAITDISVPMVAVRSGVSVPTIYRYFATKDALLHAAAEEPARRAAGFYPRGGTDGMEYLRTVWESFAEHLELVRHQVASTAGRDMRERRYQDSKAWFAAEITASGIDPESPEGARLARLLLLLTSSLAFLDLHDRQGLSPSQAADDVEWAAAALHKAAKSAARARRRAS